MTSTDLRNAIKSAIAFAERQDAKLAAQDARYIEDANERERSRLLAMLVFLSSAFQISSEESLHEALQKFLDREPLDSAAAEARARNKPLASSEHYTSPAPGTKR